MVKVFPLDQLQGVKRHVLKQKSANSGLTVKVTTTLLINQKIQSNTGDQGGQIFTKVDLEAKRIFWDWEWL